MYNKDIYVDELTGVLNRRYLHLLLDREFKRSKRYLDRFSVLIADLDDFKLINDSYGHLKGDNALIIFADVMKMELRESDTIIRYGGDEFVIILPGTTTEDAKVAGERILERLKEEEFSGIKLSASMGVATYPEHGVTWENVFNAADRALYEAKRMGKNRVALPDSPSKILILPTQKLAGRREEKSQVAAKLKEPGKLHIISGEVGVGKTRLLIDTLRDLSGTFYYTRAIGTLDNIPYLIVRNLIKYALKKNRALLFLSFERMSNALKQEIIKLLPSVFKRDIEVSTDGDKYRIYEAVLTLLSELAKKTAPIFIFDDLQWIDRESAEFLSYMLHSDPEKYIIFGIFRSEEIERSPFKKIIELLGRLRLYDEIQLSPLSYEDTKHMLHYALGGNIDMEFAKKLYGKTGGNPFFIEEVLRNLYDLGFLNFERKIWSLKKDAEVEPGGNIEDVVETKVETLSIKERVILEYTSISGRRIDPFVIAVASSTNEGEVFDALDKFTKLNLLREDEDGYYFFVEEVIRDVVKRHIPKAKKRFYHKNIAETLKNVYSKDIETIVDELVYHYEEAGMDKEAVHFCGLAGKKAFNLYSYERALSYYSKVIDTIDNEKEAEGIAFNLYIIFRNIGKLDIIVRLMNKLKEKYPSLLPIMGEELGDVYFQTGQYKKARQILEDAIEHTKSGLRKEKLKVRLAWALMYMKDIQKARAIARKAIVYYKNKVKNKHISEEDRDLVYQGLTGAYNTLASSYVLLGNPGMAIKYYKKYFVYLDMQKEKREYNRTIGLVNLSIAYTMAGEFNNASAILKQAKVIAEKLHSMFLIATISLVLGEVYISMGEVLKAWNVLTKACKKYEIMDNTMRFVECELLRIEDSIYRRNFKKALELIHKAQGIANELKNEEYIVELYLKEIFILLEIKKMKKVKSLLSKVKSLNLGGYENLKKEAMLMEAKLLMQEGILDKAEEIYKYTLNYESKAEALWGLAILSSLNGDEEKMQAYISELKKEVKAKKDNFEKMKAEFLLAEVYWKVGIREKAGNIFNKLYENFEKKGLVYYITLIERYLLSSEEGEKSG